MRESLLMTLFAVVTTSIFGVFLPAPDFTKDKIVKSKDEKFVFQVAVVGKIAPQGNADRNARVGKDVWDGAQAFVQAHRQSFDLIQVDDSDTTVTAKQKSEDLASNPRTLAVIGHSRSATTQAGIKSYSDAGIPFIIPVATAQSAVYPSYLQSNQSEDLIRTGKVANNFFRLHPSDDKAQAPAISFLVQKLADAKINASVNHEPITVKVHLVKSTDTNTSAYCKPLGDKIKELLRASLYAPDKADDDFTDLNGVAIAQQIQREYGSNDIVIFCGYPDQARSFLKAAQKVYESDPTNLPSFIFTEAATDIEKEFSSLVIYRTAPDDINRCDHLPQEMQDKQLSSEFVAGFDAAQIVSTAAQRCGNRLSRNCLLKELQSSAAFAGTCRGYSFRHGESVLSNYYVFKSNAAQDLKDEKISSSIEISAGSIIQIEASKNEAANENH